MSDLINREDAVKTIIRMCAPICDATNDLVAGINALPSAELPKGELISRADAIAYIDRVINSGLGRNKSLDYIRKYISALPSAEAEWIPCSEKLPSESGDYLCTIPLDADETYTEVLMFHKGGFYEDDAEWGATYHDDVLAWMPLPKPYREDSEL